MRNLKRLCPFVSLAVIAAIVVMACNSNTQASPAESYLDFPEKLIPTTPYDVDTSLERRLLQEGRFAEAQRIFEVLSWQMFLSLNWPLNEKGEPMPEITDAGSRSWESWKESYEVFKEDGSRPLVWGSATDLPIELKGKINAKGREDVLFRTSKFSSFTEDEWKRGPKPKGKGINLVEDEVDQAFTAPIWDQSGNIVRYEIRLNKPTVDYLITNELYNLDGQIAFSQQNKNVVFPSGTRNKAGAIELKFAWKILMPGIDFGDRYYSKPAWILDSSGQLQKVTVGLVGIHIGAKTASSPQWIWATFEQVDNLETDALTQIHGRYLRPSFYNPDNSTSPINLLPDTAHGTKPKNQIQRVLPIPVATQQLNKQVQGLLKKKNSLWQYYQLIGTQWPTDPSSPPYPLNATTYTLPDAVTNKSGGKPVPTYLTNMVMETYFQGGTITPDSLNAYIANEPAWLQIEGFPKGIDPTNTNKKIFGTEGCVNCHSSASIAVAAKDSLQNGHPVHYPIFGPPRTGDFEWLMQRKAHFKTVSQSASASISSLK